MIASTLADRVVWLGFAALVGMFFALVAGAFVVWANDPRSPLHWAIDALGACHDHPGDKS